MSITLSTHLEVKEHWAPPSKRLHSESFESIVISSWPCESFEGVLRLRNTSCFFFACLFINSDEMIFFFQSVNRSSFMCVKMMKLLINESFLMIPMWDFIVRFRVLTRAKLIKLERLITYQVPTSDSKYKFKKKRQFEMNHWLS